MVSRSRTKRSMRKMRGGQETAGATSLPVQWYHPKQPLASSETNMMTAYGKANPVSSPCGNLAAFPRSSGIQTGGLKKKVKSKKTKKRSTSKKSVKNTKSKKSVKKSKSKKSVKKSKSKKSVKKSKSKKSVKKGGSNNNSNNNNNKNNRRLRGEPNAHNGEPNAHNGEYVQAPPLRRLQKKT